MSNICIILGNVVFETSNDGFRAMLADARDMDNIDETRAPANVPNPNDDDDDMDNVTDADLDILLPYDETRDDTRDMDNDDDDNDDSRDSREYRVQCA